MKAICLCSSRKFFDRLKVVKGKLEKIGYEVILPSMKNIQDDFFTENGRETEFAKIHHDLIKNHFKKINGSDAILVCNYNKKGIQGYIGGNTLIEMSKAFDKEIPIFLLNPIPKINYRAEILAMQPIILEKIEDIKRYL